MGRQEETQPEPRPIPRSRAELLALVEKLPILDHKAGLEYRPPNTPEAGQARTKVWALLHDEDGRPAVSDELMRRAARWIWDTKFQT